MVDYTMRLPPSRLRQVADVAIWLGLVFGAVAGVLALWLGGEGPVWFRGVHTLPFALFGAFCGALPGAILNWIADWRLSRRLGVRFLDVLGSGDRR